MEIYGRSNLVESMWPQWCMIEALREGTRGMRQSGTAFLPQWPLEDAKSYQFRLETSFLFNAMEQTVESLSGRPFAEPIKLNDNIPESIRANLEDVDMEGRNLHAFAHDLFEVGVAYGHAFILVDFPTTTGAATQADLAMTGARPYMTLIKPMQVLYWNAERVNGVMTLQEIRIWEIGDDQAGMLTSLPVMQVRILKPDSFEVWRPAMAMDGTPAKNWQMIETGVNTLGKIPIVPFYAQRTGFMTSKPPLLDLAYLNIEHWQSASDQRNILHVARVPLLTIVTSDSEFTIEAGASRGLLLPMGSKAEWVETTGHAISAGQQDLQDIEERMRQLGAELIIVSKGGRQSATAAQILDNKSESKLGSMAQSLEDAVNIALYIWAQWINEPEGGTVEIYQNFGIDAATAADQTLLLQATLAGKLSDATFYNELQRRGTVSTDVEWDKEKEQIDAQGPEPGTLTLNPLSAIGGKVPGAV